MSPSILFSFFMYFVSSNSLSLQRKGVPCSKIGRKWEKTQKSFQSVCFLRRQILQNRSEVWRKRVTRVTNLNVETMIVVTFEKEKKNENKGRKMRMENVKREGIMEMGEIQTKEGKRCKIWFHMFCRYLGTNFSLVRYFLPIDAALSM